jgi:hypothetical protein
VSSAARMRELRERRRLGLRQVTVAVDEDRLVNCLEVMGRLLVNDGDECLRQAIEKLLDDYCRKVERDHDL